MSGSGSDDATGSTDPAGATGERPDLQTSIGPDANVLAAAGYIVWVLGAVLFVVEDESDYVRFHGLQSTLVGIALLAFYFALSFVVAILSLLSDLLGFFLGLFSQLATLAWVAAVLYMAWRAYHMDGVRVPGISGFVENQL